MWEKKFKKIVNSAERIWDGRGKRNLIIFSFLFVTVILTIMDLLMKYCYCLGVQCLLTKVIKKGLQIFLNICIYLCEHFSKWLSVLKIPLINILSFLVFPATSHDKSMFQELIRFIITRQNSNMVISMVFLFWSKYLQ